MSRDIRDDLEAFVSQVTALKASRFGRKVLAQESVTLRTSRAFSDVEFIGVDEEEFRSFLLSCRLLYQNNERISIFNIWTACKNIMGVSERFAPINAQRWMLNDYLDQVATIADHAGNSVTNREILETFLYGSYAHLNRKHGATLRQWQSSPRQYYPLKLMFILAVKILLQTAGKISGEIEAWFSEHPGSN
jgi:hypothetical protein